MGSRAKSKQQHSSTAVDDIDDLDDPVLNMVRFGINNVKKYINDTLPKCPTERGKKAMASKMEKLLVRLIKSEMMYTKTSGIVTEVADEMPDNVTAEADDILQTCDEIAELSHQRIAEYETDLSIEEIKQHPMYERLMHDMEEVLAESATAGSSSSRNPNPVEDAEEDSDAGGDGDGEELEVQSESDLVPLFDPITKKPLKDPIKNKKCGHVYGKASISQLIKQNNKLRCPTPGCSNKDFLRVAHLVADPKLNAELKKRQEATKKLPRR